MEKKTLKSILLIITYTLCLAFVLFKFSYVATAVKILLSVLFPFILGASIAFVLNVPLSSIERVLFGKAKSKFVKNIKRPVSIVITLVLVIGVLSLVLLLVIPEIGNTVSMIIDSLMKFPDKALELLNKYEIDLPMVRSYIENINIDWESVVKSVWNFARSGIGSVFNSTFGIISSVLSGFTSGLIGFMFSLYVLSQKEKLASQGKRVIYAFLPEDKADWVIKVLVLTKKTFSNFITGQCVEAVILGTMFFVTLLILRFHYALLIGVLIALTALVPIFGAFVGCAVGTFLLFVVDPMEAIWFLVIFQVLQQIEGNLIYPHVVGGSVGLPSIWVLVAVSVGGSLFGVVGMLVFIPLTSVLYTLFREKVISIEKSKIKVKPKNEKVKKAKG